MGKIILSEFVERELEAVWDHIATDNPEAAGRFLDMAEATFKELAQMPGMGRKRQFASTQLRNLHSFRIKDFDNFIIFYRPTIDGIQILHVLHGARDLEDYFKNSISSTNLR